jgi:predicted Zn-dependent protease
MLVHVLDQFPAAAQPIAAATFGLGADPAVMLVVPGSAAARAGLQAGDSIQSIAGKSFPARAAGKKGNYARVREIEEHLLESLAAGPVPVDYVRAGVRRTAVLEPEPGCLSRVQISVSPERNAKADGTYAQVTSGIVNFARSDDELALVIAHEMAHNILGHRLRLKEQKVSRGLLKSIDGSARKIRSTEVEADYLALYMLARAGYDIGAAPGFWQRYGPNSLLAIFSDGTHPGRSTRVAAAEATIREIRKKQQQGSPLTPS